MTSFDAKFLCKRSKLESVMPGVNVTAPQSEYEGLIKPSLSLKLVLEKSADQNLARVGDAPATSVLKQYHKHSDLLKPSNSSAQK